MEFRLLGPLEVLDGRGRLVDVGRPKQRSLLALMLTRSNQVVSVSAIVAGLWAGDPPASAENSVQGYVSRLRKVLDPDVELVTVAPGYRLEVGVDALDIACFEQLARDGRAALARGDVSSAATLLSRALGLCRGSPLGEFANSPFAQSEGARLGGLVRLVEEELVAARLALGEHCELVPELYALVEGEPLSERRWGQLMMALYRSGRQADALAAFQRARRILIEQLGLEPGPELRRIESDVLAQTLVSPEPLPRGSVTFLLTDVEGSTRWWEEDRLAMAGAMARHDEIAAQVVGRHHGQLRKTRGEGDSTFSVFAQPSDAVGAAIDLQRAVGQQRWPGEIHLAVRAVIHTGEAELRDGDYFGPAVNRAARVRSAAHGGQVLVTEATAALVVDGLGSGINLRDLGRHRLKDLDRPERLYQLQHGELRRDFPPLATLGVRTNLPGRLASFVGREREQAEVAAKLAASRLVTVTGPGGCGKTTLAIAVASTIVDRYPDGVWFVDLAPLTDPERVPNSLADALSVRARPGQSLLQSIGDYLSQQSTLILIDNCEHVAGTVSEVIEAVLRAAPGVYVLATSREQLRLAGELNWPAPALSESEAVQLFTERARAVLPDFEVGAGANRRAGVERICERLDRMPLAIELAAARVNALSVEQIATRLDDALRFLGDGVRTAILRQRTLRATLDWSYDLLSTPERSVFDRLAVFPGGFTVEAVEAVAQSEMVASDDVVGFFARLVNKSLVVREACAGDVGPSRYRLLETLRQYGSANLAASGARSAVRASHAAHYADLAEEIEPHLYLAGSRAWFDRLAVEHDNFVAALQWAFVDDDRKSDIGARLVGALQWGWFIDGRIAEGRSWADAALAATHGRRTLLRGRVLVAAAMLASGQSDLARTTEFAGELCALGGQLDSAALRANGLDMLGVAHWARGKPKEAAELHRQAIELYHTYADDWDEAAAMAELGRALADAGELDEARSTLELAVRKARTLDENAALGFTLDASATFALTVGELDTAAALIDEAVEHYRASGYQEGLASGLNTQALVALARSDLVPAQIAFNEALTMCRRLGHLGGAATALDGLARVEHGSSRFQRATELCAAAAAMRTRAGAAVPPHGKDALETFTTQLSAELGSAAFHTAWSAGQSLNLDQASELAALA